MKTGQNQLWFCRQEWGRITGTSTTARAQETQNKNSISTDYKKPRPRGGSLAGGAKETKDGRGRRKMDTNSGQCRLNKEAEQQRKLREHEKGKAKLQEEEVKQSYRRRFKKDTLLNIPQFLSL